MRTILFLFLLTTAPMDTFGAATTALGVIEGKDLAKRPAKELTVLIAAKPKETLFIVTGTSFLNENVTDYYKWFYDTEKKELVQMRRSTMKAAGERLDWIIWHDVKPADFATSLPYDYITLKIKVTTSPYGKAVESFLARFSNPKLTVWP